MSPSKQRKGDAARTGSRHPASNLLGLLIAFLIRRRIRVAAAAAAVALGLGAYFLFRDTSVVLAVPKAEVPSYTAVLAGLSARPGAPKIRIVGHEGTGESILTDKRPGLAAVPLSSWVLLAYERKDLKALPAAAFRGVQPALPACMMGAARGSVTTGSMPEAQQRLAFLPLAFDPWLVAWHRDFIGGKNAAAPKSWAEITALAKTAKKKKIGAIALPGREADSSLAWLAVFCGSKDADAAAAAFREFPVRGRSVIASGFDSIADMQKDGFTQAQAFSYPWSDALQLLLTGKAAGMLLPLSLYRGIDPVKSAPLVVSLLPAPDAGSAYPLVADLRVLVMPDRGAAGIGADKLISFLAEATTQRALADRLSLAPAVQDAPIRDGASSSAAEAARMAGTLIAHPAFLLGERRAAEIAAAVEKTLRSPGEVISIVEDLYEAR